MDKPLKNRVIAVPETRLLDPLSKLLTARGATVWPCPLVGILDAQDPAPVDAWLQLACTVGFDELILLTGEGLRRLLARAAATGLQDRFIAALAPMRKLTRGPKPAAALREIGLRPELAAAEPTTAGVIDTLRPLALAGRRVAVQLYGTEPNLPLREFLDGAGAQVFAVAPYRYADAADADKVVALIQAMARGEIDAITFTSSPQLRRMETVARERGLQDELQAGWEQCLVAAVGPVVRDALTARGIEVAVMPDSSYFIKPLVKALSATLAN